MLRPDHGPLAARAPRGHARHLGRGVRAHRLLAGRAQERQLRARPPSALLLDVARRRGCQGGSGLRRGRRFQLQHHEGPRAPAGPAHHHPGDPRNVKNKGEGWSEWELVKAARPRFPGHRQPKVPQWGYGDESDPSVMAQKIDTAADHGIDAFIFDWYYYDDGPFLDRPIDIGFLQAKNNHRLKFALMWANHDWQEIQPYKRGAPPKLLFPGRVTPATFEKICDHVIKAS